MKTKPKYWILIIWSLFFGPSVGLAAGPETKFQAPGPHQVQVLYQDWQDQSRKRLVPVKIYFPENKGPCPVTVFSHGLGGTRETYEYLGRHWASHGYISVHVQHQGSDDEVWKDSKQPMQDLRAAVMDPRNSVNRPADVSFALDQLLKMNQESGPWSQRIDAEKIGVAGHSFGAYTALAIVGQVYFGPLNREITFTDPRFKAAIVISPPVGGAKSDPNRAYGQVRVPTLLLTGTKDTSPIDPKTSAVDRRLPYDHINGPDKYLLILTDADHMVFAGQRLHKNVSTDPRHQDLVRMVTIAFWEAYLRSDPLARSWLAGEGCAGVMNPEGLWEKKVK